MRDPHLVEFPGDPRHPDHGLFLAELGKATYTASRVASICFDILRVLGGESSAVLYSDPLGKLESRLRNLNQRQPALPGLSAFLPLLKTARETRNDLLHALPVQHGLYRRKSGDLGFVRKFYTVEDVTEAVGEMEPAARAGSSVLYADGGAAVKAWTTVSRP